MRRKFGVPAVICTLGLAACQTSLPPNAHKMTVDEIRQTTFGTTTYGVSVTNGQTFVNYFFPDGSGIKVRTSAGLSDEAIVRIEPDGQMCSKYKIIRGGAETCYTLWTDGNKWYSVVPGGTIIGISDKRAAGNPENL
jgi:hypothetical protein